ncbi:11456_t:CDS:2, partial [Ambispora gerdemannii]
WTEIEVEDSDLYESFLMMHDVEDTIIKRTPTQNQKLTPCIVVDTNQGEIKRCDSTTSLRQLEQMIGTWEIDANAVEDAKDNDHHLGVCYSHFILDQNKLHDQGMKQSSVETVVRRIHETSMDATFKCHVSMLLIVSRLLRDPLHKNHSQVLMRITSAQNASNKRHCDDTSDALRDIGKWLISIAESSNLNLQEGLLALITPTLTILNKADQNSPEIETTNLPS